jgi:SAM-dependent methyltransferase
MQGEFSKYRERGAYHWSDLSRNPFRAWPYTRSRVQWVVRQCRQARTVLEIGCGDGAVLGMLARRGVDVTGVDAEPRALELARREFEERGLRGSFYQSFDEIEERRYDAIVLAEVIEHVESPEEVLDVVGKHLEADGSFVLTTPIRLLETSLDPHHVHEFWPGELEALLRTRFDEVSTQRMHPVWLIDLMCRAVGPVRPVASLANLVELLTGIELLDRLRSPLGLYWTQGAVCRRLKES